VYICIYLLTSLCFCPQIDLTKILELKGLKKADTERIVEAYNLMHSSASEGGKKFKKMFNLS